MSEAETLWLEKEEGPFVIINGSLFRVFTDRRHEITDPESFAHILSRSTIITEAKGIMFISCRARH